MTVFDSIYTAAGLPTLMAMNGESVSYEDPEQDAMTVTALVTAVEEEPEEDTGTSAIVFRRTRTVTVAESDFSSANSTSPNTRGEVTIDPGTADARTLGIHSVVPRAGGYIDLVCVDITTRGAARSP